MKETLSCCYCVPTVLLINDFRQVIDSIALAIHLPADVSDVTIEQFDTVVHLGKQLKEI